RVEQKLNDADIVLAERKTYLKELKKERDQAAKFRDLDEKIKRNKKTVVTNKLTNKNKELDEMTARIKKNEEQMQKYSEKMLELHAKAEALRGEIEAINKEVERKGEKEQVEVHKQVEELKVKVALKTQRTKDIDQEIKRVKERKDELRKANKETFDRIKLIEKERKETAKEIESREKQTEQLKGRVEEFKKKHNMEDAAELDEKIAGVDKEAEALQEDLAKLREEQQSLFREKDRMEVRLEQADDQINKVLELKAANKAQVGELRQKKEGFKKTTKELSTALNEDSSYVSQLGTARNKLLSRREELSKFQAQHASIKEGMAGGVAVQQILKKKNEIKGIYGTVAELGSVNEQYALALEIAAGPRLTSIIVENDGIAKTCIDFLRKAKSGRATFLPINKIRAPEARTPPKQKGVIGRAVDLVEYDPKYRKVFEYVFGTTVVVDSIETARSIGIGSMRMVTLQGDLIETSGAMTGGYTQRKRGVGFQHKEVSEKISALDQEVSDLEKVTQSLERKRRDNEELIERLRKVKAELEGDIIRLEKILHLDSDDLDMNEELKDTLTKNLAEAEKRTDEIMEVVSEKNRELAQLKMQKQELREQLTQTRSPAVLAQLNTFSEKKEELQTEIITYRAKLHASEAEVKTVLGPENEKISGILKNQDKEIADFVDEQNELKK
ncbi:hypothetical protein GOV10_00705, partial [Candidatus Woesearchaeota archaeon]|nr:hypothetical protein [Candidatus Woesearchaeota archaeon]